MSFIVAILALIALIIVHEFGHFVVAKLMKMRVEEFGVGYPPRALTLMHKGGTRYTLNWLPFGGFVKIYGEHGPIEHPSEAERHDPHAFYSRPRFAQALVLVAGIAMNLLFAYVLITGALISGTPRALSDEELARATHLELAVAAVLPASPAERAGLAAGDIILEAHDTHDHVWQAADSTSFSTFVDRSQGAPVTLSIRRNGHFETMVAVPVPGLVTQDPDRFVLGVQVAPVGVVPMNIGEALTEGAKLTWGVVTLSAVGLYHFFGSLFTFSADLSQVAGPVGITALIGQASVQGLGDFLSIVAIISVSLALINLVPVPALDGGRLLIVVMESLMGRRVNPRWIGWLNTLALVLLIPLMFIVSIHDIWKLLG